MRRLGNEEGFSFLEVVLALGIIMILVSALVPLASTQIKDAKIARAKDDVALIASAISQFNTDTGEWPIWKSGKACSYNSGYYSYLYSAGGAKPAGVNLNTNNSDTIDNQLVYDTPGGGNSTKAYLKASDNATTAWRGPYLRPGQGNNKVLKDPWGNDYVVNAWALAPKNDDGSTGTHYVAVVISAGPNEKIDTPITSTTKMTLSSFKVKGDDIACVIK